MNFELDDPFQDEEAMLWIRDEICVPEKIGGRKLVCGHTPVPLAKIESSLSTNKILLDGGCVYYGTHPNVGYLVALELETLKLDYKRCVDWD